MAITRVMRTIGDVLVQVQSLAIGVDEALVGDLDVREPLPDALNGGGGFGEWDDAEELLFVLGWGGVAHDGG